MDVGLLVNAVVYVPGDMLTTVYDALKPGGEAAVNFRVASNPHNDAFYDHYIERGGFIIPGKLDGLETAVLDYRDCTVEAGSDEPDEQIRQLGQQTYFRHSEDVVSLIERTGFEITGHDLFNFASPVNPDNQVDVFSLRKP